MEKPWKPPMLDEETSPADIVECYAKILKGVKEEYATAIEWKGKILPQHAEGLDCLELGAGCGTHGDLLQKILEFFKRHPGYVKELRNIPVLWIPQGKRKELALKLVNAGMAGQGGAGP